MSFFKNKPLFKITVQEGKTGRSITFPVSKSAYNFINGMKDPKIVGFEETYR